jgi:hypothetical protein
MRFGKRRGVSLSLSLALAAALGLVSTARADGWHLHPTLPCEVPAYDYSTGGEYFAPPVPYGHYAKDYHGEAAKAMGLVHGMFSSHLGKLAGLFHICGDDCGHGDGCGHGLGHGCNGTDGNGCGFCAGRGLFHHGNGGVGSGCGIGGGGLAGCLGHGSSVGGACGSGSGGHGHKKSFAPCHASTVAATAQVQAVAPSAQVLCGDPGCGIAGKHSHHGGLGHKMRCRLCGGGGCGGCGGAGIGDPCSGCGGNGCKACGGCGLFHHGKGTGCGLCGGKGCAACLKGLASKAHGLLGSLTGLLHPQKFDYFVGAGGPVPLTPGYVPYIVTTRSPRDYFAFPPMNPNDP